MPDKAQLLKEINESSFAVNDITLYLDTHPQDMDALQFFQTHRAKRKAAMQEFESNFYPLTVDCIENLNPPSSTDSNYSGTTHWTWSDGPAPWEGGTI